MNPPAVPQLGETTITRIGLGTNRLARTPANEAFLKAALDAGVNFIDTAYMYVGGESETTIGAALAPWPAHCIVATKGAMRAGEGRPDVLRGQIEESLRRLDTKTIDLYYLHRVDPETPLETSLSVIAEYRDQGVIGHIGVSAVDLEQLERARAVVPVAAVQNRFNLAERRHEDVIDYCAEHGILYVPFYPMRGQDGEPVARIAAAHEATPSQIALAWLLRRSPAMVPIPGTLSIEHLRENLGALEIELTDDEYRALS
ncbi:MAG TPA: aldo/keto reductase [Solirubrobacteraceae bacterium]|jgi:aryl-alcohol dehydrogenase-like predicted oxidoreductase|nr:aldo/keto reductase [Solirubrobacteraceae bacterium]